jgi:hypothetical protein
MVPGVVGRSPSHGHGRDDFGKRWWPADTQMPDLVAIQRLNDESDVT